jgi:hypothetical protein
MLRSGKTTLTLAVAIAAWLTATIAAPAALGSGNAGTTVQTGAALVRDGRSPDTKDAGIEARRQALTLVDGRSPDTVDAALAAHSGLTVLDGRSPDTKDAALGAASVSHAPPAISRVPVDGRSPDTRDAATLAHSPVVTVIQSPGFAWDDFAIGIAAALGLVLLLAASVRLLKARPSRKQQGPVATA